MAFSTRRGRPPRASSGVPDLGTPELRSKQRTGITGEPIDLCLQKGIITPDQHRSGLHLRWLYTLRYGAPNLTTKYHQIPHAAAAQVSEDWRAAREQEYRAAIEQLQRQRFYEAVLKLTVYNVTPSFMNARLLAMAWHQPALAHQLATLRHELCSGLELLVQHWRIGTAARPPQATDNR